MGRTRKRSAKALAPSLDDYDAVSDTTQGQESESDQAPKMKKTKTAKKAKAPQPKKRNKPSTGTSKPRASKRHKALARGRCRGAVARDPLPPVGHMAPCGSRGDAGPAICSRGTHLFHAQNRSRCSTRQWLTRLSGGGYDDILQLS